MHAAKLTNGSLCGWNNTSKLCERDGLQSDWQPGATTSRISCLNRNQNRKQRPTASENYPAQAGREAQNSFPSKISLCNRQKQLHVGQTGSLAGLPLLFWLASELKQAACYTEATSVESSRCTLYTMLASLTSHLCLIFKAAASSCCHYGPVECKTVFSNIRVKVLPLCTCLGEEAVLKALLSN